MGMPIFVIIVISILVTGLVLLRPMAGLVLLIYCIALLRFPTAFPSFMGIFTQLSVVKLLGGLSFVSVFMHNLVEKKRVGLLQSRQAKFFLLLLLWVAISGFTQPGSFTRESFTKYASLAMLFYIVVYLVDSPQKFRLVLWSCIISMLGAASLAIFQQIKADEVIRARSTFLDSNYFNLYLLPIIPVAFYRISDERSFIKKFIAIAAAIILILAVVFTFSRGGMIGLAAILFLMALNSKRKILAFLILGIIIIIFMAYMPNYFQEKIETTKLELRGENPVTSTYRRMLLAKGGWKMFLDKPLTGIGVGNFYWNIGKYGGIPAGFAHDMYIEVAAELGLIGIFLFMGIIFLTLKDLKKIIKKVKAKSLRNYARGLYVGFMGFLVAALFLHAQYEKFLWIFIFLTICLKKITVERAKIKI